MTKLFICLTFIIALFTYIVARTNWDRIKAIQQSLEAKRDPIEININPWFLVEIKDGKICAPDKVKFCYVTAENAVLCFDQDPKLKRGTVLKLCQAQ